MLKTHRTTFIILIFCLLSGITYAQGSKETAVTGAQKTTLTEAVSKAHQQLKTLSADFTQEKKSALFTEAVVQKGSFWYKAPKQLRWEYKSPKALTLLFDEKKVTLLTEKGPIDNPNRMLNELGKMIINTINGNNMSDNENFDISFLKNSNGKYIVLLNPVNKKIKANYHSIRVILNAQDYLAEEVIMNESNGDVTTIIFSNKKTNQNISADKFSK
ncbi:MAG: outer membrane lipoprotein carrier protein LolA [Bacteroidales bacterium]|nr:outer membrane lipoprotein carrier protein LolA [Bacteroidales bacterium]